MQMILIAITDMLPAAALVPPVLFCAECAFVHKPTMRHRMMAALFALYLCAVFSLSGVPDFYGLAGDADVNWLPLQPIPENFFWSILLFVPLGMMLPVLWREYRALWRTALFGSALSLCIELSQLVNLHTTDVNDWIANTAGILIGWTIAIPLRRVRSVETLAEGAPEGCGVVETVFISIISFLILFFMHPLSAF